MFLPVIRVDISDIGRAVPCQEDRMALVCHCNHGDSLVDDIEYLIQRTACKVHFCGLVFLHLLNARLEGTLAISLLEALCVRIIYQVPVSFFPNIGLLGRDYDAGNLFRFLDCIGCLVIYLYQLTHSIYIILIGFGLSVKCDGNWFIQHNLFWPEELRRLVRNSVRIGQPHLPSL